MKDFIKNPGFIRLLVLFIITTALVLVFQAQLSDNKIDPFVVGVGNLVLFLASLLTLAIYGRAKMSTTTHGFSRNVYAAFVIKFFILITVAMLYFLFSDEISPKAVFVCLGLYLFYHFMGASYAARVEKKKKKQH